MSLTPAEKDLLAAVAFDEDIGELVKDHTGCALSRLAAFNDTYELEDATGLSVEVDRASVVDLIAKLQPHLVPRGYRAFWSDVRAPNGQKKSEEIAVLKTTDQRSIVELRRSNGANYGVTTNDVIRKIVAWETACQLEVIGAARDWVALQFQTLPENICAFAEEIYQFCPDTVEQGFALINESEEPEAFKLARELCPRLSETLEKKLAERQQRLEARHLPPHLREMLRSGGGGFTTPTDMGIRLLAHYLKESKQLFLWWD